MEIALLVGRLLAGYYFISNGWSHLANMSGMAGYAASKKVPSPKAAVVVTGLLLLLGGLSILLGVAVSWGIAALLVFMVPVTLMMHDFWKEQDPAQKGMQRISFWKNVAIIGLLLMLYAIPLPWPYAF